jgi:DNA-binding NarL/FixJ family response regulator
VPEEPVIGLSTHEEAQMAKAMQGAGLEAHLSRAGSIGKLVNAIRSVPEASPALAFEQEQPLSSPHTLSSLLPMQEH